LSASPRRKTGITVDTALRLSKALGTTPQLWLNVQTDSDPQLALRALGKKLAKIEPVAEAESS
jgi:addiction module HigA family antidote